MPGPPLPDEPLRPEELPRTVTIVPFGSKRRMALFEVSCTESLAMGVPLSASSDSHSLQ